MGSLTDAIGLDCRTGGPGRWVIGGTEAGRGNSKGGRWCRKGDKPFTENSAQPSFIGADMPTITLTPKQIGENKQRLKELADSIGEQYGRSFYHPYYRRNHDRDSRLRNPYDAS
jgi:hypothetical protein